MSTVIATKMPDFVRFVGLPAGADDAAVLARAGELAGLRAPDVQAFLAAHRPAPRRTPSGPGNAPPPPPPPPAALSPEEAHVAGLLGITPEQMIASRRPVAPRPPRPNPDALTPEDLHVAKTLKITPAAMLATKRHEMPPVETEEQRRWRLLMGR